MRQRREVRARDGSQFKGLKNLLICHTDIQTTAKLLVRSSTEISVRSVESTCRTKEHRSGEFRSSAFFSPTVERVRRRSNAAFFSRDPSPLGSRRRRVRIRPRWLFSRPRAARHASSIRRARRRLARARGRLQNLGHRDSARARASLPPRAAPPGVVASGARDGGVDAERGARPPRRGRGDPRAAIPARRRAPPDARVARLLGAALAASPISAPRRHRGD